MFGLLPFLGLPILFTTLYLCREHYQKKLFGRIENNQDGRLAFSPSLLKIGDIIATICFLILKYVPEPFGYRKDLRPNKKGDGFELPPIKLTAPLIVNQQVITTFSKSLKQSEASKQASTSENDPAQNPFLLISLTTPLLLLTVSHPSNPLKPLGAVNTRNRFTFHSPALLRDTVGLIRASEKGALSVRAEFGGPGRSGVRKRRGVEFDVVLTVLNEGKPMITQEMSYLQFLPQSTKPLYVEGSNEHDKASSELDSLKDETAPICKLDLDTSTPRRWAASCKDYNPIHIFPLLAPLFNFRSSIMHGNHVAAMAVQSLREDRAHEIMWKAEKAMSFELWFRSPIVLPCRVQVVWADGANGVVWTTVRRDPVNPERRGIEGKAEYVT